MNDYDKAGRYLVKREPAGFYRWLLANPRLFFQAWIDARRVALPNQNDLTNDLIAVLGEDGVQEAVCLELEVEARADALTRLLEYLARLWAEPSGRDSLPVVCVSGVVLDLTGRSRTHELKLRSALAPSCRLELTIIRRPLADESAARLVADVAAGTTSPWLLPWVPLMQGGGESGIIEQWLVEAERRVTDLRDRAVLGSLTRVFAALAECQLAWDDGLRGWDMQTSPIFDEMRAEGARTLVLRLGRKKFGKAPTKKQQQALGAITELGRLEDLAERLLAVDSWAELLGEG